VLYAGGIGVEPNMAEAYKWFALAASEGDADSAKKRDETAARLDPRSLKAAIRAVESWKPMPQPGAALHVRTPPQGWDAPTPPAPLAASGKRQPRGGGSKLDLAPASTAQ
jgi:localization factor PodJL